MVIGLDIFRQFFRDFENRYVLIGGTASSIVMEEAGAEFRATKDLDIVLCIEIFDSAFALKFWEFVNMGEYTNRQISTGKRLFYRFHSPKKREYPFMLELFSKIPDSLSIDPAICTLTPIPVDDEISSLSAIILEPDYYNFIHKNTIVITGLPVVGPEILIPLKVRAWLDLSSRKEKNEGVDSRDIRKHRNDIFRLFPLIPGEKSIDCSQRIKNDMILFIERIQFESRLDLKALGIRTLSLDDILTRFKTIYKLQ